ncbi:NADP-dependent oxidoreductase [Streptomyces sp. NPDC093109]|uniref:NADP-dependent oxidoreductase n=1 Tax=Streptomyces sp. NPDC093109 TaxID=3154977 RepID=UPI00344BEFC8
MKAVFYRSFGDADVLEVGELPEPTVGPDSVLIRVRAASVNPVDWKGREGHLAPILDAVFPVVPGWDVAGVVERTGLGVTEFSPGDEVIGYVREDYLSRGSFAELTAAPVRALAHKPTTLSWAQAAGLPLAGLAAYQALVRTLDVRAGETVLVHGAAGGVGSLAVQIAVGLGARVLGTAGEHNHDFVRFLGGEPVAYRKGLTESVAALAPEGVDVILDAVGRRTLRTLGPLLATGGRLASVVDPNVRSVGGSYVFARPDSADLAELARLAGKGRLVVEVSEVFPLEKAADAHRLSQAGHTRGKIVVTLD